MTPPQQRIRKHEEENQQNEWLKYLMDKRAAAKPAIQFTPQPRPFINSRQAKAVADGK